MKSLRQYPQMNLLVHSKASKKLNHFRSQTPTCRATPIKEKVPLKISTNPDPNLMLFFLCWGFALQFVVQDLM